MNSSIGIFQGFDASCGTPVLSLEKIPVEECNFTKNGTIPEIFSPYFRILNQRWLLYVVNIRGKGLQVLRSSNVKMLR